MRLGWTTSGSPQRTSTNAWGVKLDTARRWIGAGQKALKPGHFGSRITCWTEAGPTTDLPPDPGQLMGFLHLIASRGTVATSLDDREKAEELAQRAGAPLFPWRDADDSQGDT